MGNNDPSIFKHSDQDNDELDVWDQGVSLLFHSTRRFDAALVSVRVNRDDVIRLHTALGAWISGDNVPVCDPDSLYGQLIRQAVHEELARVIPECLAQTQAPAPVCTRDESCDVADDPEPHDVGHPTYEDARPLVRVGPSHCGECTHPMNDHIAFGGCWGNAGTCACEVQQDAPVPVVESDKVWGEAGQPPVKTTALKCTCIHETKYPHRPEYNGCSRTGCLCEYVPSAPALKCTCGHPATLALHGNLGCEVPGCTCKYAPSAPPVRCNCEHDRQMHGRFGCRVLGCVCRWKRGTS